MVPRAHSTLASHSEVKQRRATQVFPSFLLTQSHKPHPLQLTIGLLGLVKVLPYDTYLLEYTMAASHSIFKEDGVF